MNNTSSPDLEQLISLLDNSCDAPEAAVDAVQYHGLAALVHGAPATVDQISRLSAIPTAELGEAIAGLGAAGRIETNKDQITGVGGLTMTPTRHILELPDAAMYTWCALDAVGIPAALDLTATVTTDCPHCNQPIHLTIHDQTARGDSSLRLFCPTGPCNDIRGDFCSAANIFCSPEHLAHWRAEHPSQQGNELDLTATTELGLAMWHRHRQTDDSPHEAPWVSRGSG